MSELLVQLLFINKTGLGEAIMKKWTLLAALIVSVVCFTGVAFAGVTMISQPFIFPYTITKPGSYQLVSNLTVPNANTTAILVKADNVTIDLNGFAILGPTVCSGLPVTSCTPTGTGKGIDASAHTNVKVSNGTVAGMGNDGVNIYYTGAGNNVGMVQNVRAESNGGNGINVGNGTVSGSTVIINGSDGIHVGNGTVSGSIAEQNGLNGIYVGGNGTVSGNVASYNDGIGINVPLGSGTISDNTVVWNAASGIYVGLGTVSGNTVIYNGSDGIFVGSGAVSGNMAQFNSGDGIHVVRGTVSGNTAEQNSGYGLHFGVSTVVGFTNNVVNDNTLGTITGGTSLGFGNTNLCNGTTC